MSLHPNSVYLLLNYLRQDRSGNKYHWMLLLTGPTPPKGKVFHATDLGRDALDLRKEVIPTNSGMLKSKSVVVALFLCPIDGTQGEGYLQYVSDDGITHLMDKRYLPRNEPVWTCRVWVKTVLGAAASQRYIRLDADLETIEAGALATADQNMQYNARSSCKIINDLVWLRNRRSGSAGGGGYDEMDVDSWGPGYTGQKPMQGLESAKPSSSRPTNPKRSAKYACKCGKGFDHSADLKEHHKRHPKHK